MAVSKLCEAVKVFLDVVDSPYGYLEGCLGLGLSNDAFELVTRRTQTKIFALGWCPQNRKTHRNFECGQRKVKLVLLLLYQQNGSEQAL